MKYAKPMEKSLTYGLEAENLNITINVSFTHFFSIDVLKFVITMLNRINYMHIDIDFEELILIKTGMTY